MRSVQPHGPYYLGGFSGGGITAYEIARQLRAAGEEVAFLGMLDTPLPQSRELTLVEKVQLHLQRIGREKHRYFTTSIRARLAWEWQKLERRFRGEVESAPPAHFHSATIEQAFRRACEAYHTPHYDGKLYLFRPKLKPTHVFGAGRMINADRRFIFHDNGWSQHVTDVEVHEVPGDHDSMVLEPNVRVLGARLRKAINAAEAAALARNRKRDLKRHGDTEVIAEGVLV
jgi:thioesterase domain-containing protein